MAERPSAVLARHRDEVLDACADFGASDIRVFGSVARGDDRPDSDLDLLITAGPDTSHFDLLALTSRLEDLLGCRVGLVTTGGLRGPDDPILRDARPL